MSVNLEKLTDALNKKELGSFLSGEKKEYYFICPYAEMPTDPDQAFDCIKEYYHKFKDQNIWINFQKEIINMTYDAEKSWLSVYYVSMYLSYSKYTHTEYIELETVLKEIIKGLLEHKNELVQIKKWGGDQFKNGLWDDANRLLTILKHKFDLKINIDFFHYE